MDAVAKSRAIQQDVLIVAFQFAIEKIYGYPKVFCMVNVVKTALQSYWFLVQLKGNLGGNQQPKENYFMKMQELQHYCKNNL